MAITGNKGEWSELYALFRLLGEGKVHAGDADLNKLDRMATSMHVSLWISSWRNPPNYWNQSREQVKEPLRFLMPNAL